MRKIKLTSPALLVIDMQRYFLDPKGDAFFKRGPAIIPNVGLLISKFRERKLPIIFTKHAHRRGEPTDRMGIWWNDDLPWEGDAQSELISKIKPNADEPVITKARYSAFERTIVGPYLKGHGVETVVICGVLTHLCVETSARHAFLLDFQPVVISDACATQTEEHHKASLLNLGHGFAKIITTKEFLELTTDEH